MNIKILQFIFNKLVIYQSPGAHLGDITPKGEELITKEQNYINLFTSSALL